MNRANVPPLPLLCALAARGRTPASRCAAASGRDRGVETKQYWTKYERVSTTKGPARGRKQRPREFRHGLLGEDAQGDAIALSRSSQRIDLRKSA